MYDDLADVYDLIYENWPASIERQAAALEQVIQSRNPGAQMIADVACGIGTQSLGLAARGFDVSGSDLSAGAIARAQREAAARGLQIDFRLDDMERLDTWADASVDAVISCDNAVPHLLDDARIETALRRFRSILKPGGVCVFSVRDYAAIVRDYHSGRPHVLTYGVRQRVQDRVLLFQVWDFDGDLYDLHFYFVFDDGANVTTRVFRSRYYAITIERLMEIAEEAGFVDVERVEDVFFQPLIVCSRP
jgi:SAM-dependent methyltransferase